MRETAKTNLPLLVGMVVISILLLFSWYFVLQPFVTIVGVVAGAVISILTQYWTQRLALKRDYSIKAIEHIYSPLYGVILPIEKILEKKEYQNTSFGHWGGCVKDYRYFMVDIKFRQTLDAFYEIMEKWSHTISRLETIIIPKIQIETAKEVFPEKPNPDREITIEINFYNKHELIESYHPNAIFHLKKHDNFGSIVKYAMDGLNLKEVSFDEACTKVRFWKADNPLDLFRIGAEKKGDYSHSKYECTSEIKNDEFWNTCLKKVSMVSEYQFIIQENERLFETVLEIKKELIKRIEKPWKI